jgi:hypothetical protein
MVACPVTGLFRNYVALAKIDTNDSPTATSDGCWASSAPTRKDELQVIYAAPRLGEGRLSDSR